MLIITGECQYTLFGLSQLLASFNPRTMSTAQWLTADDIPAGAALLIVASQGLAMADLLPVAEKAHLDKICRLALMGDAGQGVFMNSCGLVPDGVVSSYLKPDLLRRWVLGWLRYFGSRRESEWQNKQSRDVLSQRELEALWFTLEGVPVSSASVYMGIAPKTFYSLRLNALKRLGLKNIRALLANPASGVPDSTSRYNCLWGSAPLIPEYSRHSLTALS